jgi:hypothetical protein
VADPLTVLGQATRKVQRAEENLRQSRRELHEAMRAAHAAGISYSAIGRVVGVSRQRVAQIVERGGLATEQERPNVPRDSR